ncbi:L-proline dehydrogenase /delta-1-pyrroline-5-carboxylate dehydrogenase [Aliiroseovarius halocynthiae]|uniref:Bifunctional protein PutA n=1 Tax=Aliiroseovarius halocynthiae TaxID=985055 RepID=A0A545SML6_9RHOB|nr:bifunctional proline dehydrogenase/L-glutamate gamma-semialdehyde dehydrogenase PutA [Aliiroseovarius halocynthiae]TQV66250.1 bifunctional proline dehydrogenase/L-glutamate gamma-semialdehyde dehydrogenase PutA [Aliiroseovarius halocynthiae]SMR82632.1 L-proline dehydrogenase /delta-1-pyrroline-5-carboxylate dehydrogenase [Aliiroseovarius halocynthiae]
MTTDLRTTIDNLAYADEERHITSLVAAANLSDADRARIAASGAQLVRGIRESSDPGLMEVFLAEYGLSTDEGIALMCLAEALLRVPDAETIDALIEDKIAPSDWGKHLGRSSSSLVNASTWALLLTGKVLEDREPGIAGALRGAVKRLGEPVIRTAVGRAMKEMGSQFVLGETIGAAMNRGSKMEEKGFTYSYDMLGEAALTDSDARRYQMAYAKAISEIASACTSDDIRSNPGISVKLSALFARYERGQHQRVMETLVPRVSALAQLAKSAGMGFNIDAEEADRLQISLDVIEKVLEDPALAGWDGFGVVVQAYGHRAGAVIDWLHETATRLDRKIMVRLVKGAYWDSEIKRAQVEGLDGFPVFTRKVATDVSYISNAGKLLGLTDRIYPQFATHNAHTAAAILDIAQTTGIDTQAYEFQRLHGMGERLHQIIMDANDTRCRIYAPVGAHRDLLAYLVRRLLENGANSSFVNQIVDESVTPEEVAACPFDALTIEAPHVPTGPEIFGARKNSMGLDLTYDPHLDQIEAARGTDASTYFTGAPLIAGTPKGGPVVTVQNPSTHTPIGQITWASAEDVDTALTAAKPWDASPSERAKVLNRAADLYEENLGLFFALLSREAGKIWLDCMGELREAVDFLRYYASRMDDHTRPPVGLFTCISPWNFPLAIFTGQIAGALAVGNGVLAKPAEQTGLIAFEAVKLLHQAGVPRDVLQLLPGDGVTVGAALTSDPRIGGVAFTGSTETAQIIRRAMAANMAPSAPLIAETGGLNAMIVDSTALPEQAVRDIVASSFQSAGQRCSALRCLYVQEDVADAMTNMLVGAMNELKQDDPWHLHTDLGPVIDDEAFQGIKTYVDNARAKGRIAHELTAPEGGFFIAPTLIRVNGIEDMKREIFGPVLHIATFKAHELDDVIDAINATGYGLTFGLHTRIDDRVQHVCDRMHVGNAYVNRNQIGAIVGSQPFGGEGLSGTGPKAGGPMYMDRFCQPASAERHEDDGTAAPDTDKLAGLIAQTQNNATLSSSRLPGPTGELNQLSVHPRAPFLCMGPGNTAARAQKAAIEALGGVAVLSPNLSPDTLEKINGIGGVIFWGADKAARQIVTALAKRPGEILPLITGAPTAETVTHERHLCVDTTASGGNAELLMLAQTKA